MDLLTKFAPANRKSAVQIALEYDQILNTPYLKEILDALPYLSAILNEERQAIYLNQNILDFLGIRDINDLLGERPGEMLACVHSHKEEGGCGTSENCRYCGAVNAILRAQSSQSKVVDECRISSFIDGNNVSFDLQIIATPVDFNNQHYTILTLNDISSLKRKEVLEKIFFHDILNVSHGLKGFIDLMMEIEDPDKTKSFLEQISKMVSRMNNEIQSQRDLGSAEKGDLVVNNLDFNMRDLLSEVIQTVNYYNSAAKKGIVLHDENLDFSINTDKVLLSRVLLNMMKNALEAESINGAIIISAKCRDGYAYISVKNSAQIPKEVKMQIFQRSFSTKGTGRGIGTYSMKLISNQYLKGDISFISNTLEGTIFTIKLPLIYPV